MAKKKTNGVFCVLLALLIGLVGGFFSYVYCTLPSSDILKTKIESSNGEVKKIELSGEDGELSFHFLELGNKYTGDCTYIKLGNIDILIDCGSRTNSISTVRNYINQYCTDNTLEYVIVTHAHVDHYAGFATSTNVKSMFELFTCETVIDFGNATNQTGVTYQNYLNKLSISGATHYTALECSTSNTLRKFELAENIGFEILYNYHYRHDVNNSSSTYKSSSENDYSVCTMFYYGERYFLFTGDLEEDAEDKLVENNSIFDTLKNNGKEYGVELYKAGHHGSKTSSGEKLLSCIRPKIVAVCCCAGSSEYTDKNVNQFPTQAFVNRVSIYTQNIFVTTLCVDYANNNFTSMNGNIVIIATAETVGVNCTNNNTLLKDTEWFKANRSLPIGAK